MSEHTEAVVETDSKADEVVEQTPIEKFIKEYSESGGMLEQFQLFDESDRLQIYSELLDSGIDYSIVQAYYELRVMNLLRSRELSTLRNFVSRHEDAYDWEDVRELLEDTVSVSYCADCDMYEFDDRMVEPAYSDENRVCRDCIDNSYSYSEYYSSYIHDDYTRRARDANGDVIRVHEQDEDFTYNDDLDEYVHYEYEHEEEVIRNYHSSKHYQSPIFDEWSRKRGRFFGVELEVECRSDRNDSAKRLHTLINGDQYGKRLFFERDGSLNDGFEMISQPMSLPMQRELWSFLNDRDNIRGLRSHNTSTCGLHVHVSRQGLSSLQIAKIVTFINKPENEELIRAIARRYAEGYCKIKQKKIGRSHQSEDRYEAVNITSRKTIEFRIFRGSLKYESVISAIEFSHAIVEFCKPGVTSINDLTTDKFMSFCEEHLSDETQILRPYINNRLEIA